MIPSRPGLLEFFSDRGFRFSRGSRGLDWIERVLDFWIGLDEGIDRDTCFGDSVDSVDSVD